MVVLEFKKETHDHTMNVLRKVKEGICELYDILENPSEAHGERKYFIDAYDERRGGGMMRREDMDERRRRDSMGRYAKRDDRFEDKRYPEYPFEERGGRYGY